MTQQSFSANGVTWYNFTRPDEEELHALAKKYHFHALDIDDCLSDNERPKIEEYPTYLFFVLHVPVRPAKRILKEEVNVFLGPDFIVTIHQGKIDALDRIWELLKDSRSMRGEYFREGAAFFLYKLMHDLYDGGFPLIDTMMKDLRRMEVELFENEEGQINILRDILLLKRNIITMRSVLFPQRAMIAMIPHKNRALVPDGMGIYFDDVHDAIERQWSILDTAKEMSDALQDTHEAWLSHKTNAIIRVLTIFSVTMLPLTFLTGLYGMNVPLPFQDHPQAFEVLLFMMTMTVATFIGYFAWKKWL